MQTQGKFEVKDLPLSQIQIDDDLQSRVDLSQKTIEEYTAELEKEGAQFPPVTVFTDGNTNWLADGFHRFEAYKKLNCKTISANVYQGSKRDAILYSVGANHDHGLRRTAADKRRAVMRLLADPEWVNWSNNEISRLCHVSHTLVNDVRNSLETASSEKKYVTKHGTVSKMNTEKIGQKNNSKVDPVTENMDDEPFQLTREEELETQLKETSDQYLDTLAENTRLRDAIALGQLDASDIEIEDIADTVRELREQIRIKDIEIQSLRESRDTFQNRAAELIKQIKAMQYKMKKAGIE